MLRWRRCGRQTVEKIFWSARRHFSCHRRRFVSGRGSRLSRSACHVRRLHLHPWIGRRARAARCGGMGRPAYSRRASVRRAIVVRAPWANCNRAPNAALDGSAGRRLGPAFSLRSPRVGKAGLEAQHPGGSAGIRSRVAGLSRCAAGVSPDVANAGRVVPRQTQPRPVQPRLRAHGDSADVAAPRPVAVAVAALSPSKPQQPGGSIAAEGSAR